MTQNRPKMVIFGPKKGHFGRNTPKMAIFGVFGLFGQSGAQGAANALISSPGFGQNAILAILAIFDPFWGSLPGKGQKWPKTRFLGPFSRSGQRAQIHFKEIPGFGPLPAIWPKKGSQNGVKMAQNGVKMAYLGLYTGIWPRMAQKGPKMAQKWVIFPPPFWAILALSWSFSKGLF